MLKYSEFCEQGVQTVQAKDDWKENLQAASGDPAYAPEGTE